MVHQCYNLLWPAHIISLRAHHNTFIVFKTNLTVLQSHIQVSGKYFLTVGGCCPTEGVGAVVLVIIWLAPPNAATLLNIFHGSKKTEYVLNLKRQTKNFLKTKHFFLPRGITLHCRFEKFYCFFIKKDFFVLSETELQKITFSRWENSDNLVKIHHMHIIFHSINAQ